MKTHQDVVNSARKLVNTPFGHQGRLPGSALDCYGVFVAVCQDLGLWYHDHEGYGREPGILLATEVPKYYKPLDHLTEGSLALLAIGHGMVPQHCAIMTFYDDWYMVHAYQNVKAVKEHRMIRWWRDKVLRCYAVPSVDYSKAVKH